MVEVNLLNKLPQTKRNVGARAGGKTPEVVAAARAFGELYFDGPREYGYGGYSYDYRWLPVAEDIVAHFHLKPGMRVLDVGAAKGFLVNDLMQVCPGLEVFGVDISEYGVLNCHPNVVGRMHIGDARDLPFPDYSFDCVLSINTLHNLVRDDVIIALKELERVSKARKRSYIVVDAYQTEQQRRLFEDWVLTALHYDKPEQWVDLLHEAGYTGDWYWTILE
jgi:SAM-dependent methyltransferase